MSVRAGDTVTLQWGDTTVTGTLTADGQRDDKFTIPGTSAVVYKDGSVPWPWELVSVARATVPNAIGAVIKDVTDSEGKTFTVAIRSQEGWHAVDSAGFYCFRFDEEIVDWTEVPL